MASTSGYILMMPKVSRDCGRVVARFLGLIVSTMLVAGVSSDSAGAAEEILPVALDIEAVTEGGAFLLADGTELCLKGIWGPAGGEGEGRLDGWRSAWRGVVDGGSFSYHVQQPFSRSRYGCVRATIENADGVLLEHALLTAGWATVDPVTVSDENHDFDLMLALEAEARKAGRGMWKESEASPKEADDLSAWIGTRQLVEGRVRRIYSNDRYAYLNFGADWRTDFTVRLGRKMIDSIQFDLASLDGKRLRIRGVLEESRGPLIHISNIKQIEYLP